MLSPCFMTMFMELPPPKVSLLAVGFSLLYCTVKTIVTDEPPLPVSSFTLSANVYLITMSPLNAHVALNTNVVSVKPVPPLATVIGNVVMLLGFAMTLVEVKVGSGITR